MKYLYLDTSDHLIIGLLNEEYNWIQYVETDERKSSGKLHSFINELLLRWNTKINDLAGLFAISGPGSYTGIRLAEGIAQIFEWQNIPVFSFNHHQIPMITGVNQGVWCANAYKGEYFIYKWNKDVGEKILVPQSKIVEELTLFSSRGYSLFTHFNSINLEFDFVFTGNMIKNTPFNILPTIQEKKIRAPSFYFRALDHEFTTSVSIE